MNRPELRLVQSTDDYAAGPDGTDLESALALFNEEYASLELDADSLGIDMQEIDRELAEITVNADALLEEIDRLVAR